MRKKTPPTLSSMALKNVKKRILQDKQFFSMVQKYPLYKNIIEDVQSSMRGKIDTDFQKKEHEFQYLFTRYIHLRLVHSIVVLLENEPESYIELIFPYKREKVAISIERDDHNRLLYLVETFKKDTPQTSFSFWDKKLFQTFLMDLFMEKFPKSIDVWRSSLSVVGSSIHSFVKNVEHIFQHEKVPRQWTDIYNKRYKQSLM